MLRSGSAKMNEDGKAPDGCTKDVRGFTTYGLLHIGVCAFVNLWNKCQTPGVEEKDRSCGACLEQTWGPGSWSIGYPAKPYQCTPPGTG